MQHVMPQKREVREGAFRRARSRQAVVQYTRRGCGVFVRPGGAATTATLGLAYGEAFFTGGVIGLAYMRLLANQVCALSCFLWVKDTAVERKRP